MCVCIHILRQIIIDPATYRELHPLQSHIQDKSILIFYYDSQLILDVSYLKNVVLLVENKSVNI